VKPSLIFASKIGFREPNAAFRPFSQYTPISCKLQTYSGSSFENSSIIWWVTFGRISHPGGGWLHQLQFAPPKQDPTIIV